MLPGSFIYYSCSLLLRIAEQLSLSLEQGFPMFLCHSLANHGPAVAANRSWNFWLEDVRILHAPPWAGGWVKPCTAMGPVKRAAASPPSSGGATVCKFVAASGLEADCAADQQPTRHSPGD